MLNRINVIFRITLCSTEIEDTHSDRSPYKETWYMHLDLLWILETGTFPGSVISPLD